MKILIFLSGFFSMLFFQWLVFNGMLKEANLASQENLEYMVSAKGVQLRITNFILSYILAVLTGIAAVYVIYE
jgi:hypothetical protein